MIQTRYTQIRFKECTDCGEYNDALYFTEGNVPSQSEIDALCQARIDAWVYQRENPPEYVEPSVFEIEQMIRDKQQEIQALETKKIEVMKKNEK